MVVAQLVDWLLPTPRICGSNPVIGKSIHYQLYWKDEIKKKEARNGHFFKKVIDCIQWPPKVKTFAENLLKHNKVVIHSFVFEECHLAWQWKIRSGKIKKSKIEDKQTSSASLKMWWKIGGRKLLLLKIHFEAIVTIGNDWFFGCTDWIFFLFSRLHLWAAQEGEEEGWWNQFYQTFFPSIYSVQNSF